MYYYPAAHDLPMSEEEFRLLRDLVRQQFGIFYDDGKAGLLKNRLLPRVTGLGLNSFDEYHHYLRFHPLRHEELRKMVSHLTNNETYFFREMKQLELLSRTLLPAMIQRNRPVLRILSAGCSSGEEPYSIAMLAQEKLGLFPRSKLEIIGIDVDDKVLEKARAGVYAKSSFRATDPLLIHRYFQSQGESKLVRDNVRKAVHFQWANLVDESTYQDLGKFDVIFCRNVLIYFEDPTIRRVVEQFWRMLDDAGYLFLGHAESLVRITDAFEAERHPGVIAYRKVLV